MKEKYEDDELVSLGGKLPKRYRDKLFGDTKIKLQILEKKDFLKSDILMLMIDQFTMSVDKKYQKRNKKPDNSNQQSLVHS